MAETPLDKYTFEPPRFSDLLRVLADCGVRVRDGIIKNVATMKKPDGSAQKQNAPSTIIRKGHDHPVVEFRGRFEQVLTYMVVPISDDAVMVSIRNPVDSNIGVKLHQKGYEFFGVTREVAHENDKAMDAYISSRIEAAFQGRI